MDLIFLAFAFLRGQASIFSEVAASRSSMFLTTSRRIESRLNE